MCQRRRRARALQHQAVLAEAEAVHDSIVINEPSPPPSLPLSPPPPPPPPSTPPLLVSRPVSRRLPMPVMAQAAGVAQESSQSTQSVAKLDAMAPSCPGSSEICCSQVRLQEYKEQTQQSGRYPTPPAAPRKDQYIPPSESEAESSDSELPLRRPPAKVFRNGQLMYHKANHGPEPITYVDTRLYEGGRNDYYEAFNEGDLIWVRRIRDVLDSHNIPRRNV
jgi:hypothetical protein